MEDRSMELALEENQDLYFYLMMHLMQDRKAEQLLQQKGSGQPSPENAARILGLAEDHLRKENRKIVFHKVSNIAQKAAVFIVAFLFAGSVAVINVEAFRGFLVDWIMSWGKGGVTIQSDMTTEQAWATPNPAEFSYVFGWLPDGCTLVKDNEAKFSAKYVVYQNNKAIGNISIVPLNTVFLNDTDETYIEYPEFEGYSEVIYFEKQYFDSPESARWMMAKNEYCIVQMENYMATEGSLRKEEFYKILENLEIVVP